jgi:hypothetical protein
LNTTSPAGASARLWEEFNRLFPLETIDEALHQSTEELSAEARVDTFIPLLAERRTRERLAALAHR